MIITAQIKQVVASEKKNNAKGYGAAKSRKKKSIGTCLLATLITRTRTSQMTSSMWMPRITNIQNQVQSAEPYAQIIKT